MADNTITQASKGGFLPAVRICGSVTGHFASLPFHPLHTELLNTVPTHYNKSWLGFKFGTHGLGLGT